MTKMNQIAPYPSLLYTLVEKLQYREGWTFNLLEIDRGQESGGLTLVILTSCADTYQPKNRIRIYHYMPVPPASYNEASWRRWMLDQILLVERHEACEFFQIDGKRPYAPHHGPGNDPYIIFDNGSIEDARTSYLGEGRETDAPNG